MFTEKKDIKNIALYSRVSTDEQAHEGFSLESQLRRLKSFCRAHGWKITKVYTDPGYSGRNTRRPAYTQMMQEMNGWDAILVIKMDRIHRNRLNFIEMMKILRNNDKEFISMSESLDTSTAMGRFVMGIIQDIAQLESEQIGERVFSSLVHKAQKTDKFMGHRLPFGYELEENNIKPIDCDLKIVKNAFDLYVNGKIDPVIKTKNGFVNTVTGKKIKPELVDRVKSGYKKNGHTLLSVAKELDLPKNTVRYYLNNIFYAGYERWCHYFRKINHGFKPIIEPELWNKAQIKTRSNCRTHSYDPILIPEDRPEYWALDNTDRKQIPIILRAKHNFTF